MGGKTGSKTDKITSAHDVDPLRIPNALHLRLVLRQHTSNHNVVNEIRDVLERLLPREAREAGAYAREVHDEDIAACVF